MTYSVRGSFNKFTANSTVVDHTTLTVLLLVNTVFLQINTAFSPFY